MADPVLVGEAFKAALKGAGLVQEQLADRIGVTQSTVSLWVRGKGKPEVERVPAIAQALEWDSVTLLLLWWPELSDGDRLAGIRLRLDGATDDEIAEVESWLDSRKKPTSARRRQRPADTG